MMQRKKGGYFMAQALGSIVYTLQANGICVAKWQAIASSGESLSSNYSFVSEISPGFIRSPNSIRMLSLSFLWHNSVVIDARTILSAGKTHKNNK